MARPLPPGVSQRDFSEALTQFAAAVGKEWVFTSDEDVDALSRRLLAVLGRGRRARRVGRGRAGSTSSKCRQSCASPTSYRIPL